MEARLKYSSNTVDGTLKGSTIIMSNDWINGNTEVYSTISFNVDESEIDFSGSSIYIKASASGSSTSESCEYPLEKDEVPSFELLPSSVTVSCGSTSPETFTVTPSNIPSGVTVSYQWDFGSGWEDTSGNPITSLTSTATSVILVPNAYPPSDVKVTPVLNGESYPQLISDVNLSNFNPNFQINGADDVCDLEVYTINNLPNGISIQSVSSSNSSIASASLDTATNEFTVTRLSDGVVTLSIVVQNTCNQTKSFTKQLQIGVPATIGNALISGVSDVCGTQNYTYTLSGANHPCVTGIVWSVSPNLIKVSETANSVTVAVNQNPFTTDNLYAGEIKANIPNSSIEISQGVWVGVPNNDGLSIQKLGAYEFYAGEWSMLKSHYTPLIIHHFCTRLTIL